MYIAAWHRSCGSVIPFCPPFVLEVLDSCEKFRNFQMSVAIREELRSELLHVNCNQGVRSPVLEHPSYAKLRVTVEYQDGVEQYNQCQLREPVGGHQQEAMSLRDLGYGTKKIHC